MSRNSIPLTPSPLTTGTLTLLFYLLWEQNSRQSLLQLVQGLHEAGKAQNAMQPCDSDIHCFPSGNRKFGALLYLAILAVDLIISPYFNKQRFEVVQQFQTPLHFCMWQNNGPSPVFLNAIESLSKACLSGALAVGSAFAPWHSIRGCCFVLTSISQLCTVLMPSQHFRWVELLNMIMICFLSPYPSLKSRCKAQKYERLQDIKKHFQEDLDTARVGSFACLVLQCANDSVK